MLTNNHLLLDRPHPNFGGTQRIYRLDNGYGLSLVNATLIHTYPFAWEAAVLKDVSEDGETFTLTYDTELTDDVEVFATDEEANAFIERAILVLSCQLGNGLNFNLASTKGSDWEGRQE